MTQENIITGKRCADMSEIQDKVDVIIQKYDPEKIILFGSYAIGNPKPNSDVDLLIIMNTKQSTLDTSAEIFLMLDHTFPLDIVVRTPQEIDRRLKHGDFFIKDILQNGKVLYERTGQ